jgi:hypothetical protein
MWHVGNMGYLIIFLSVMLAAIDPSIHKKLQGGDIKNLIILSIVSKQHSSIVRNCPSISICIFYTRKTESMLGENTFSTFFLFWQHRVLNSGPK